MRTIFKNYKILLTPSQKGFRPANELGADGKPLSYPNGKTQAQGRLSKGEVLVGMKDGVEYVLRFGEIYRAFRRR